VSPPITVVIVDAHDIVRAGIRSILARWDDVLVVGEAATVTAAIDVVVDCEPELVLLGMSYDQGHGNDVSRALRAKGSAAKILVLSSQDQSNDLATAMAAGADGYLVKNVTEPQLIDAINRVITGEIVLDDVFVRRLLDDAQGGTPFTRPAVTGDDLAVLELIAAGRSSHQVAEELGMSRGGVELHLARLFKIFGVDDRVRVVTAAFKRGILR
jgi:DNA-binding NarL/FixJ family response regulator